MAFVESWVETDPDGSVITGSLLDDYQRQHKRAIRERLEGNPSDPNSGIFEYGSLAATSIVRAGTARAYAVLASAVPALILQDGRIAITTDTRRLYHLRASGVVELAYMTGTGDPTASPTFDVVHANAFDLVGFSAYDSGRIYMDITNGLIMSGIGGLTYDAVILNGAGAIALAIPTGTVSAVIGGGLFVNGTLGVTGAVAFSSTISATAFIVNAAGVSTTGVIRLATGTGLNWRNSTNTGDISVLYTSGGQTHIGAQVDVVFDKQVTMPIVSGVGAALGGIPFNIFNSAFTSTTLAANVLLRIASNAGNADCSLCLTDNVTYNTFISAKAGLLYFTVNSAVPVSFAATGINTVGLITLDDQSQKLTIGRFSVGSPISYIQISPNSSAGFAITNAAGTTNVMLLDNSGNVTFSGILKAASYLDISGSAIAVAAGHLALGGNTSTSANTYGGGGVSALPAQPAGYLPIFLGATNYKVPYYTA